MMPVSPPLRSYLYVPGSDQHMMEKALATEADALVFDLEDAVAPSRKVPAREQVARMLRARPSKPIFVRINSRDSGLADDDLAAIAIAGASLAGIRLPKVEAPEDVCHVAERLARLGCDAGIQCLIESALGVERAFDIARAHTRVSGLGLGETDLMADLGVSADASLAYARSRIVVASRAAGLPAPVQSVYTDVRNLDGLQRSTADGKRMGFVGRSVIHPAQVAVVNAVFTPDVDEIRQARELVARLERAAEAGTGAIALQDGRFVDRAVVESARRTLALARYVEESNL